MVGPPVNGDNAAQTLLSFTSITPGYCLKYVWQAYQMNGAISDGQYYPTAYTAWQQATHGKHPDDWNPPSGVPVYFGPKSSSNAGDVVISLGGGQCAATDWPYGGVTGVTTLTARQSQIGRPYLGWIDNILGNPITSKELDMPLVPADKQVIKDALLEFYAQTGAPPPDASYKSWPFFDFAVWQSPIDGVTAATRLVNAGAGGGDVPPPVIDYDALAQAMLRAGLTLAIVQPTTPQKAAGDDDRGRS